jgi:hypothetical protein
MMTMLNEMDFLMWEVEMETPTIDWPPPDDTDGYDPNGDDDDELGVPALADDDGALFNTIGVRVNPDDHLEISLGLCSFDMAPPGRAIEEGWPEFEVEIPTPKPPERKFREGDVFDTGLMVRVRDSDGTWLPMKAHYHPVTDEAVRRSLARNDDSKILGNIYDMEGKK